MGRMEFKLKEDNLPSKCDIEKEHSCGHEPQRSLKFCSQATAAPTGSAVRVTPVPLVTSVAVLLLISIPLSVARSRTATSAVAILITGANVVIGALAIVDQDLVRLGDLLEAERGVIPDGLGGLRMPVGVVLQGEPPECSLDLFLRCAPLQP